MKKRILLLALLFCFLMLPGICPAFRPFIVQAQSAESGEGMSDEVKALLRKAKKGDVKAQVSLGYAYSHGEGVRTNYKKAVEWYGKAAAQGDAKAQYNLGMLYKKGQGVEQSYEKAAEWYTKAAEQGNAKAQNELGILYKSGRGVEQSDQQASTSFPGRRKKQCRGPL